MWFSQQTHSYSRYASKGGWNRDVAEQKAELRVDEVAVLSHGALCKTTSCPGYVRGSYPLNKGLKQNDLPPCHEQLHHYSDDNTNSVFLYPNPSVDALKVPSCCVIAVIKWLRVNKPKWNPDTSWETEIFEDVALPTFDGVQLTQWLWSH